MTQHALILRPGHPDDAELIAALHIASWRETYRGLLPDRYLRNEIAQERRTYWLAKLAGLGEDGFLRIAEDPDAKEGESVGFVYAERQAAPAARIAARPRVLVDNLHVLPHRQGTGAGKAMLAAVETWARAQGASELYLHAMDGNRRAIEFYRRQGWLHTGTEAHTIAGTAVTALNFSFPL
jgi:GNAT superfamily N-acetyltransferase